MQIPRQFRFSVDDIASSWKEENEILEKGGKVSSEDMKIARMLIVVVSFLALVRF